MMDHRQRRSMGLCVRLAVLLTILVSGPGVSPAQAAGTSPAGAAAAPSSLVSASPPARTNPTNAPNVPYDLPVTLPSTVNSPAVAPNAPYSPVVLSLIAQLEPSNPPTLAQVANLAALIHDGASPDCHNVGPVGRPYGLDSSGNPTNTTLATAAAIGDTNIKVASVTPYTVGQTIWIDATSDAEQATITDVGTPGAAGTGITLAAPLTRAHANGRPVYRFLTTPSIPYLCWTDAQGVLNTSGSNARGSTGPMTLMGLAASFDRLLGNAWGQTEGTESRAFMVTGLFGPQTDLDRQPNWGRNLTTTGEDPFLSFEMVATQINGMQGVGTMSQMKHFAVYNGQSQNANTDIQDQPLHELYLTPYEGGFVAGQAAATMCSYQIFRDISAYLPSNTGLVGYPAGVSSLAGGSPSPYRGTSNPQTWPLNESHYACEQPLILTYILHQLWNSVAFVGSDYPATHSTAALFQGEDQEMPSQNAFFAGGTPAADPSGSICADAAGFWSALCVAGTTRIGGIPNNFQYSNATGCAAVGCTAIAGVTSGNVPLSVFNQSLARILYQEERFGMLGCDPTPGPSCTNPGGIGADRTGTAPLPLGPTSGPPVLGTKNGDAAIVEKMSEEGATLLKNQGNALPLTSSDLAGGILVAGSSANHTVADPTNEASTGFIDRDAVNPLQQLKALSGNPGAFTFVPVNDPTGQPVGPTAASPQNPLSTTNSGPPTGNLARTTGPGSPTTDATVDFTAVSPQGQLAPGNYTWTGYLNVASTDVYTFSFAQTAAVLTSSVTLVFDGITQTLTTAPVIYGATTPSNPTNDGYTEPLLTLRTFSAGSLTPGYHSLTITFNNTTAGPASFRFGFSRTNGDLADAAAAAVGKSKAIVFVNTGLGVTSVISNPYGTTPVNISAPETLSAANVNLINAVAAANPNTIVVLNNDNPVLTPWIGSVKALLDMWFAGQEGGTSTARLLLGQATPGGHTALTWPANATDTIWGYNETVPLYPGEPAGPLPAYPNVHLERLNFTYTGTLPSCVNTALPAPNNTICTNETEGIFAGYRFFDQEGLTPQFPFGYGLSYTTFGFANPAAAYASDGGADVSFDITNTGAVAGTDVAQVYVGAGPAVAGVQQAVRALRGFQRVQLNPGQTQHVTIHLDVRSFQYWDEVSQSWKPNPGARTIWIGDADALANLPLHITYDPFPPTPTPTAVPSATPAPTSTPCSSRFSDVQPADYFYTPVLYLACNGVVSGYADGTFRPYANTTRGQLAKMIVLAKGWPLDTSGGPHFSDVLPGNPFYSYIETAYHRGIISGYDDGTFQWGAAVTRGQLAKITVGAQGWTLDTSGGPHFSDVPASAPFYAFIETAYHHGLISGYGDGTFRPAASATRGQIAKIVYGAVTNP